MEKKTTFNLRAGGGATTLNLTLPYTQGIEPIEVTSLKVRKVNGKEDGSSVQVGYVINKPPYGYIIGQTIDGFEIHYKENSSNNSRNGVITLTQNESNKQCKVNFTQEGIPITDTEIELTITNLPTNGTGALFGEFEIPNSNSTSKYFSFSITGTSHKFTYKKSTGLIVNLSTPGETDTAHIGDIIRLYTWEPNSTGWVYRTQFALPSSDTTIPAY